MYLNYKRFSISFSPDELSFSIYYRPLGSETEREVVRQARISVETFYGVKLSLRDFGAMRVDSLLETDRLTWCATWGGGPEETPEIAVRLTFDSRGCRCRFIGRARFAVAGLLQWGDDPEHATFAVRRAAVSDAVLRAGSGPAVGAAADALFDRLTDRRFDIFCEGRLRLGFDWSARQYNFAYRSGLDYGRELVFSVCENCERDTFNIPYAPIDKSHGFEVPPVGWMTWYAVRFDACESVVLENAAALKRALGDYTDKLVLWVDWEWCHRSWEGTGETGADIFHPRREPYPNGIGPVAAKIAEIGLIPALWIGATNEGRKNADLEAHPDWVLGKETMWCGQWWIDPSHPEVASEYIPKIFRMILNLGYRMIKWDCLPATLQTACQFHGSSRDAAVPPDSGLRRLVKAARDTVGKSTYMLSCSGDSERDICCAMDYFNAARIGGDIFGWEEFLDQAIGRVLHCYPWHNTVFYTDADNLVLREEFNTLSQARTRVSFYGLAGLPVTIGDRFSELDDARIDLLRRIVPPVEAHPTELAHKKRGDAWQITSLRLTRPFGEWSAVGVANLTDSGSEALLDFRRDLDLDTGDGITYAVFDFWNRRFLGVAAEKLALRVPGCDTAVLRITSIGADRAPLIVGSSRHVTQGGVEIEDFAWVPECRMVSGVYRCAAGEKNFLYLYLPGHEAVKKCSTGFTRDGDLIALELAGTRETPVEWSLELV